MLRYILGAVFASSFAAHAEPARDLIPVKGIYKLEVTYKTEFTKIAYPPLNRMVILSAGKPGRVHVALSQAEPSRPFITFPEATYTIDPESGKILVSGIGGSGVYGEITVEIDPKKKSFKGFFTDSLAEGYKELKGEALTTVGDLLSANPPTATSYQLTGVYDQIGGNRRLIVRHFTDGSISVAVVTPQRNGDRIIDTYSSAAYFQELGVLTAVDTTPSRSGAIKELTLVTSGPAGLKVQLISTAGRSQNYEFVKSGVALLPEAWDSSSAQDDLKARAQEIKKSTGASIEQGAYIRLNGDLTPELTAVLGNAADLKEGHTTFFIGYRENFIPRSAFYKFLTYHVKLVSDHFKNRGLKAYFVLATSDYEIAIMNWESEAAMQKAFAEAGQPVLDDAAKFLKTVVWEKY